MVAACRSPDKERAGGRPGEGEHGRTILLGDLFCASGQEDSGREMLMDSEASLVASSVQSRDWLAVEGGVREWVSPVLQEPPSQKAVEGRPALSIRETWAWIPTLLPPSWVTLGKALAFSELQFPVL